MARQPDQAFRSSHRPAATMSLLPASARAYPCHRTSAGWASGAMEPMAATPAAPCQRVCARARSASAAAPMQAEAAAAAGPAPLPACLLPASLRVCTFCWCMQAKAAGLWNLWLPAPLADSLHHLRDACTDPAERGVLLGARLNNLEYAHVCEVMGRCACAGCRAGACVRSWTVL